MLSNPSGTSDQRTARDSRLVSEDRLPPDDVWKLVFGKHLDPSALSTLCLVCKRFLALCTSEDVFKRQCLRLKSSSSFLGVQGSALSWRQLYRNMRALKHLPPIRELDFQPFPGLHVSLLASTFVPPVGAVFYDADSDAIMGWPSSWRRPRADVCPWAQGHEMRSLVASLGTGDVGFVDPIRKSCTFLDPESGVTLRCIQLSTPGIDAPLSVTWTSGAVHSAPVCVRGGRKGTRLVYVAGSTIFSVDGISGRTQRHGVERVVPFENLVRGTNGSVIALVVKHRQPDGSVVVDVSELVTSASIAQFQLPMSENLVDVVMSDDGKFVACRVLAIAAQRVVAVIVHTSTRGDTSMQRYSLYKPPATHVVRASTEFSMLGSGRGVVYKPELSVQFCGSIQVILRREDCDVTTHTLKYGRVGGSAFKSASVTSDGSILVTCAENGTVSWFDLECGKCICSFPLLSGTAVLDSFISGIDHAFITVTDAGKGGTNVHAFHFDRFCRSKFPACSLPLDHKPASCSS